MAKDEVQLHSLGQIIPIQSVQRLNLTTEDVLGKSLICTDIEMISGKFGKQAILTLRADPEGDDLEMTIWSRPMIRQLEQVNRKSMLPMIISFGMVDGNVAAV